MLDACEADGVVVCHARDWSGRGRSDTLADAIIRRKISEAVNDCMTRGEAVHHQRYSSTQVDIYQSKRTCASSWAVQLYQVSYVTASMVSLQVARAWYEQVSWLWTDLSGIILLSQHFCADHRHSHRSLKSCSMRLYCLGTRSKSWSMISMTGF